MAKSYTLAEIAKWVGGLVRGDASVRISGVSGIEEAAPSQITWLAHEKYIPQLRASRAGAAVVPEQFGETPMPALLTENPAVAIAEILGRFAPPIPRPAVGVHPTAIVASSARIGRDVAIGPHAVVGEKARIGDRTVLHANVFVGERTELGRDCELWPGVMVRERCTLGDRVIVHPNTSIGADGYGYQFLDGRHAKIPQIGTVEIEDDVEIGANCCIDRAKFGVTRIGAGTKIDNLVQVAHNVQTGSHCLIVAQCGIGGSARLGTGVVLGGKAGLREHVVIGDGAQIGGMTGISKDVPAGRRMFGIPAVEYDQFVQERSKLRRLPKLADQVKTLIERVERLEATADDQ